MRGPLQYALVVALHPGDACGAPPTTPGHARRANGAGRRRRRDDAGPAGASPLRRPIRSDTATARDASGGWNTAAASERSCFSCQWRGSIVGTSTMLSWSGTTVGLPAARQRSQEADVSRAVGQRRHRHTSAPRSSAASCSSSTYPVTSIRSRVPVRGHVLPQRVVLADLTDQPQPHVRRFGPDGRECPKNRQNALFRRDHAKCGQDHVGLRLRPSAFAVRIGTRDSGFGVQLRVDAGPPAFRPFGVRRSMLRCPVPGSRCPVPSAFSHGIRHAHRQWSASGVPGNSSASACAQRFAVHRDRAGPLITRRSIGQR